MKRHWVSMGIYFGYPNCCIEEFLVYKHQGHPTCISEVHNHHGFIPCERHRQEILDGKIKIEALIVNRICKTPYPIDDEDLVN